MPKIIENLEERLKQAAEQQIREIGYANMTIRSVATACGIGVGTVYNYYPSKDDLLAAWMLDNWNEHIATMEEAASRMENAEAAVKVIYDELRKFARHHASIFRDEAAAVSASKSFHFYHSILRAQLAVPLRRFCEDDFGSEFAAESLLTWTMSGKEFEVIWEKLQKLF